MSEIKFGQSTPRREDERLVRGQGVFTADLRPDGLCHAFFVRSPHVRARILGIDALQAASMPGVIGVFTAADLEADKIPSIASQVDFKRPDGSPAPSTPRPLLSRDEVRHLAEPVAMVLAESAIAARDAGEAVAVDYDPLPAVTGAREALAPGAPAVWDRAPGNVAYLWQRGDKAAVDAAIASAAHVTRLDYSLSRVGALPLEPRVTLARPVDGSRIEVHSSTQTPFELRDGLARLFGMKPDAVRVIAPDVGGSFGLKAGVFREDALVFWAAKRLQRPVRWMSDRAEAFLTDDQARDVAFTAALALDKQGAFLALRVRYDINVGAYLSRRSSGSITNMGGISGAYRTPLIAAEAYGVLTNTVPTAPYRGAGRPDATYVIERLIDVAAAETGIGAMELRRRNLIPAAAMPYKTGFIFEYDTGDFAANMDAAARRADIAGFPARKAAAAKRGRLRGLGVSNPVEAAGGPYFKPMPDNARMLVQPDGKVHVHTGAMSVGQGLETVLTKMAADKFGVPLSSVVYHQGDTDLQESGRGSGGSSGLCVSGSAVALALDQTIEAGRKLAAEHFEALPADVDFKDAIFALRGTNRSLSLTDVAKMAAASGGGGLAASAVFQPAKVTFPNGCHVCEVEIDPETGAVEVVGYVAVEDIGRVVNPLLAQGQIHGGVAQGLGQALCERIVHDGESGQLLTGSFTDYAMPRAGDMPPIVIETREVPTKVNALGAKGVGEAGTIGAISAAMNAVCDALAPLGVRHVEMPATPDRVWAAIQAAKGRQ